MTLGVDVHIYPPPISIQDGSFGRFTQQGALSNVGLAHNGDSAQFASDWL